MADLTVTRIGITFALVLRKILKVAGKLVSDACMSALGSFISEKVKHGLRALWNRLGPAWG